MNKKRILIANRGEIACRIIKSVKELGFESVVIYSKADKNSKHVREADFAVCVGEGNALNSYLNIENILIAAKELNVDGIHPGYGFLSERADFVEYCEDLNLNFIGPSSDAMKLMGDKINALLAFEKVKDSAKSSFLELHKKEDLRFVKKQMTLPLIIKHAGGGGGKGMRIVRKFEDLESAYDQVLAEAKLTDRNPRTFVEKYIENAKHIEIQVLCDNFGNCRHLGSRDCSMQRKNQKLIEEAPSGVAKDILEEMYNVSLSLCKEIKYKGAGTLEFLVKDAEYHFLEMNTRVQVEHTVTEEITGIDIVKEQINMSFGEKISFSQTEVKLKGHSIECRINAEDPFQNFMPTPGKITTLDLVSGDNIRLDFGIEKLDTISPFYDSMVGKIIVTMPTRKQAIQKMIEVLEKTTIKGIKTNKEFNLLLLKDQKFINDEHTTNYVELIYKDLIK